MQDERAEPTEISAVSGAPDGVVRKNSCVCAHVGRFLCSSVQHLQVAQWCGVLRRSGARPARSSSGRADALEGGYAGCQEGPGDPQTRHPAVPACWLLAQILICTFARRRFQVEQQCVDDRSTTIVIDATMQTPHDLLAQLRAERAHAVRCATRRGS